jgi:hypothetical protein
MRHFRRADASKEHAEHGEHVGGGTESGARISAEPLLIDDDRRREIVQCASGWPYFGRKYCTKVEKVSLMSRCDSAAMVSKTSELLPLPEMPVNTVIFRRGISSEMFFRLFSRARLALRYGRTEWSVRSFALRKFVPWQS